MAKFRLGEEVVIIYDVMEFAGGAGRVMHPAGTEGVVDGLPRSVFFDPRLYLVMVPGDKNPTYCEEHHLRRKTGSWDEIERTTGFRPSKRKTPEREPETVA